MPLVEIVTKIALDNQELFANDAERLEFEDYFKALIILFAAIRVRTERDGKPALKPNVEARRTKYLNDVKGIEIVKKHDDKAKAAGFPDLVEFAKAKVAGMDLDYLGRLIDRIKEFGLY